MENVRNHRDIKLLTTEGRRNYIVSEPNYHIIKKFSRSLLEMKRTRVLMNKPVFLGLSVLQKSKTVMHEFWYDYVKPKYGEKVKLSTCVNTDSFIVYVKTEDISIDIAKDVETRFYISNYELDRPWPKWQNIKVIGIMKDKLGWKIMREFTALRPKHVAV